LTGFICVGPAMRPRLPAPSAVAPSRPRCGMQGKRAACKCTLIRRVGGPLASQGVTICRHCVQGGGSFCAGGRGGGQLLLAAGQLLPAARQLLLGLGQLLAQVLRAGEGGWGLYV
jgi:hypothetical protein